jgi:hypothetical protein
MSLTAERSASRRPWPRSHDGAVWITTTHHKKLGVMYCVTAFSFPDGGARLAMRVEPPPTRGTADRAAGA